MTDFYRDQFLGAFNRIVENNRSTFKNDSITSFVGWWYDSAVLKLQKKGWSSPVLHENPIHAGIFFSIWISEKSRKNAAINYNIHALKLRDLEGYSIKSREFAEDFRAAFAKVQHLWEKGSVDYGPQTLMEGSIRLKEDGYEKDIDKLVKNATKLFPIIDRLLEVRKKV